jgi:hypothetical protein
MSHLDSSFVLIGDTAYGTSSCLVSPLSVTEQMPFSNEQLSHLATCSSLLSTLHVPSEWGIGALEKCFQILKVPLPADDLALGKILWEVCLHLFNIRVCLMKKGQVFHFFNT